MSSMFTKLEDPSALPAYDGRGCAFSPDGVYLAVAHYNSPFITIYKREVHEFTKLANPSTLPTGTGNGCAFSPDGVYLAVGHNTSPFITIYKREGDTFTKLANPNALPPNTGNSCSFSPNGVYLIVAHNTSPFITIYKREGDTFTKLANPSALPTNNGRGCSFSPDGVYLAVGHSASPCITIYKCEGDTFTKLANPSVLPTSSGNGCAFSPDGIYLAVAQAESPFMTIYKREGDTFTKLANPSALPPLTAYNCSFSPDGVYLAVAHYNSPFITIYEREGDTFTKLANPSALPTGTGNGCSFSPDGVYLAVAHSNSPRITIYIHKLPPAISDLTADITSTHKESITISFTVSNADGGDLTYQISINGEIYQSDTAYTEPVNVLIPASAFTLGTNSVLISVSDGFNTTTGELFIVRTNTTPVLTGTLTRQVLHAVIGDADVDTIRWRALLNGAVLYDWSDYAASPVTIHFLLPREQINIGIENNLRIEYEDEFGAMEAVDFDFVGSYIGILFYNSDTGEYYSDDQGNTLHFLDFGVIVAGGTSNPHKVTLRNFTGAGLPSIEVLAENVPDDPDTVNQETIVEFAFSPEFLSPSTVLTLPSMDPNSDTDFWVRVRTDRSSKAGGIFTLRARGDV